MDGADARWLTLVQAARLTGVSDETLRKWCQATPRVHFPNARQGEGGRWEIAEDELYAAQIVSRSVVLSQARLREPELARMEALRKIASSSDDKFSLNQVNYLVELARLDDPASAEPFEKQVATPMTGASNHPAPPEKRVAFEEPVPAPPILAQPQLDAPRTSPTELAPIVRPGVDVAAEFLAFMTANKNPTSLSDEFFAGEVAPEFIPPVGVEYHVAGGPGPEQDVDEFGLPSSTWVLRFPRWTYDGANLQREGDGEFIINGRYRRGHVPAQYAAGNEEYCRLRDLWNLRAADARARLKGRALMAGVKFLPDAVRRPDVGAWLRRYEQGRLHPSELPDAVKMALVDVEFIPPHNVFFYKCTGDVREDGLGGTFTVIGTTFGFSDDFGPVEQCPLEPLDALLMWPGIHEEGEVRPRDKRDNAEYLGWKRECEDMRQEGRRLRERLQRERLDGGE